MENVLFSRLFCLPPGGYFSCRSVGLSVVPFVFLRCRVRVFCSCGCPSADLCHAGEGFLKRSGSVKTTITRFPDDPSLLPLE